MSVSFHVPVLRDETLRYLITDPNGLYVDATLGGGGHAQAICAHLGAQGRLAAFDADERALRHAAQWLTRVDEAKVTLVHANFASLERELNARGISAVQGILFDLGVSSHQLDAGERGFSFRSDERIDMRMDRRQAFSGLDVVNTYDEERVARVIRDHGEERNARRIARHIVNARPLETTGDLQEAVRKAVGGRFLVKSLARVFQAIRIEVNNELESLSAALQQAVGMLLPGGRLVVISYHSLEDRIVKETLRKECATHEPSGHKLVEDRVLVPRLKQLTKKPVRPEDKELAENPRARSAKMRVAEKLPGRDAR
jgi:16S rRNA (cytosine1402-N4)-methyltransferase